MRLSTETSIAIIDAMFNAVNSKPGGKYLAMQRCPDGEYNAKACNTHKGAKATFQSGPGYSVIVLPYGCDDVTNLIDSRPFSHWVKTSLPARIEVMLSEAAPKNNFQTMENDDE